MHEAFDSVVHVRDGSREGRSFVGSSQVQHVSKDSQGRYFTAQNAGLGEWEVVRAYLESKRPRRT